MFSELSDEAHLEGSVTATGTAICNLSSHLSVYRRNKAKRGVSWEFGGEVVVPGRELTIFRERDRRSARPIPKLRLAGPLPHHSYTFTQSTTTNPIHSPAPPHLLSLSLLPGLIHNSTARIARTLSRPHDSRRPLRKHAFSHRPVLGEVPEELRRRRGRGEEDHTSDR